MAQPVKVFRPGKTKQDKMRADKRDRVKAAAFRRMVDSKHRTDDTIVIATIAEVMEAMQAMRP